MIFRIQISKIYVSYFNCGILLKMSAYNLLIHIPFNAQKIIF
jgi:hypothetical protein